ncbi:MAG: response regulator transcription factor [Thiogranum sp.]|nr:response regulator transcription factor [Thiogranum sp.]
MSGPVRIAIVDDHEIVRRGFRELLADDPEFEVVLETSSGDTVIEVLRNAGCDLVLLDISLPEASGVDILRTIRRRFHRVGVLVLSGFPESRYALPMIRNGADGYLCKDCEPFELIAAIRAVARGQRYISAATAELLAEAVAGEQVSEPHQQLSERELQVFLRLAQGWSVSAIATRLHVSTRTVSVYRSRVMTKMGHRSDAGLASYAVRHGLADLSDGDAGSAR